MLYLHELTTYNPILMKKLLCICLLLVAMTRQSFACGYFSEEYSYYNLFLQELVDDPRYYPFLLTLETAYYESSKSPQSENIKEWQHFLGLSYDDTYHLVFEASRDHVRAAIDGNFKNLPFLNADFVKRHKQALLYISYAKYLEPYMRITHVSENDWDYFPEDTKTADQLDYDRVMTVLQRSWSAETENELKLRYGYQMVRFAHYNRKYNEAIQLFDKYVEPLRYKPAMYYHALAQKAGAMAGAGNITEANFAFMQVFANSDNLKVMALNSIKLNGQLNFMDFAKTDKERFDAMLLLGYTEFNNPIPMIEKIVALSPDAIQARVLMARVVNQLERERLPLYAYHASQLPADRSFPLKMKEDYMRQALSLASKQAASLSHENDFWNITAAYLHFLDKDFKEAQRLLHYISPNNVAYRKQKENIARYIDFCAPPLITADVEQQWYNKYGDSLISFEIDVIANKYFLQKEYAKSFMMSNEVHELENSPDVKLIDGIEKLYLKANKNEFEKFILSRSFVNRDELPDYLNYLRGVAYLSAGDLDKAATVFTKSLKYIEKKDPIDLAIFGYNIEEGFDQDVMILTYLEEFSITGEMNYKTLTDKLRELQKIANAKNSKSAKANFLLGNFFYNTCNNGYFREKLRFDQNNGFNYSKFSIHSKVDIYGGIYFKEYPYYYHNTDVIAQKYHEKAYSQATDNELKARIVFVLSKGEQQLFYEQREVYYRQSLPERPTYKRVYFKELMKYGDTDFFREVKSKCNYFNYYVTHL